MTRRIKIESQHTWTSNRKCNLMHKKIFIEYRLKLLNNWFVTYTKRFKINVSFLHNIHICIVCFQLFERFTVPWQSLNKINSSKSSYEKSYAFFLLLFRKKKYDFFFNLLNFFQRNCLSSTQKLKRFYIKKTLYR